MPFPVHYDCIKWSNPIGKFNKKKASNSLRWNSFWFKIVSFAICNFFYWFNSEADDSIFPFQYIWFVLVHSVNVCQCYCCCVQFFSFLFLNCLFEQSIYIYLLLHWTSDLYYLFNTVQVFFMTHFARIVFHRIFDTNFYTTL